MYCSSLIPADVEDAERTVVDVLDSLRQFQTGVTDLFGRLQRGVDNCRERICAYDRRVQTLERKIDYLKKSADVPTLTPPARYPTTTAKATLTTDDDEPGMHICVLNQLPTLTPFHMSAGEVDSRIPQPSTTTALRPDINRVLSAKSNYVYAFADQSKFLEAAADCLQPASTDCESNIDNWRPHVEVVDPAVVLPSSSLSIQQGGDDRLLSESLLVHCDFGNASALDPYSYQPDSFATLADKFKLPDLMTDMSAAGLSSEFDAISIASSSAAFLSSSAATKSTCKRTMDVDLTASRSFYAPVMSTNDWSASVKLEAAEPINQRLAQSISRRPDAVEAVDVSKNLSKIFASSCHVNLTNAGRSESTVMNGSLRESNHVDNGIASIATTSIAPQPDDIRSSSALSPGRSVPPPPPPLPPPATDKQSTTSLLSTDVSKGHSDLMQAIRAAGGTKNARLKKVLATHEADSVGADSTVVSEALSKANDGDDLMSSLAKALEVRRQGIAGKKSTAKQFAALERRSQPNGRGGTLATSDAFSRLRQIIPAAIDAEDDDGEDEDDGDW